MTTPGLDFGLQVINFMFVPNPLYPLVTVIHAGRQMYFLAYSHRLKTLPLGTHTTHVHTHMEL